MAVNVLLAIYVSNVSDICQQCAPTRHRPNVQFTINARNCWYPYRTVRATALYLHTVTEENATDYVVYKPKAVPLHAMKALGEETRYSSYSFRPRNYMGVCGQRHAPAALCPGERTPVTHCTGDWMGPRAGLDTDARGKILSPLPGTMLSMCGLNPACVSSHVKQL
jgi:hypothetical protein